MVKQTQGNKKKATTSKKPIEAEVVDAETEKVKATESPSAGSKPVNMGQILWGLVLILFGTLLLMSSLGVVEVNWSSLWQLWPLIIILVGVSTLDLKGWLSVLVTIIVIVLGGALVITTLTGNIDRLTGVEERSEGTTTSFRVAQERNIERAEVTIKSGAGEVVVGDHSGRDLVDGRLESVITKLSRESRVDDRVQEVELSLDGSFRGFSVNPTNNFDVNLNRNIPIDLYIDAGASSIKADLSEVEARLVDINTGASSVWIRMGGKLESSSVNIDTGVSSVEIEVPQNAGVRLNFDGGLSSRDLPDDFNEVDDDVYQSEGYSNSEYKIELDVDMGLSSFTVVRY